MTSRLLFRLTAIVVSLPLLAAGCFSFTPQRQDGGVFRSADAGDSWEQKAFVRQVKERAQLIDSVSIKTLVADQNDSAVLYLGTASNGVYKTTNHGESWSATGLTSGGWSSVALDPTTSALLYAGSGGAIYKSADAGSTWSRIYVETRAGQSVSALAVDPNETPRLVAGMNTGLLVESVDYGGTWRVLSLVSGEVKQLILYPHSSLGYLVTKSTLFRTTDRGVTWTPVTVAVPAGMPSINNLFTIPDDSQTLALATNLGFLRSRDGGERWQSIETLTSAPAPLSVDFVAIRPDVRTTLYALIGNKFHRSDDDGLTWSVHVIPTGRRVTGFLQDSVEPNLLFLSTYLVKK